MESLGVLVMHPDMPYLQEELEELDKRFTIFRYYDAANKKDFLSLHSPSIRAVVGNSTVGASAELIDALPNLEIVSTYSVGLDKVDLRKCRERGIKVTNTPDVLTDDVADLAIGLMICTLRHICASDRYVRNGHWRGFGNYKLTTKFSGKTVGIVGLGRIGMAIAKRSEVFGCTIIYHSRSENPGANYRFYSNIVDLAAHSDILVLACPLTEETHHIVNQTVINALGPEGVLVNIGRGSLVDEPELVKALLDKRLGGAGLDVFEWEPEPPKELFDLDNVVLLPHVGSSTVETSKDMADLVVKNLEAYAMGRPLLTPVLQ